MEATQLERFWIGPHERLRGGGGDRKETWRFVDTCESSKMEIREGGDRNRRKFFRKEKIVEWIEVATLSIICYFKENFGKFNDNREFFLLG